MTAHPALPPRDAPIARAARGPTSLGVFDRPQRRQWLVKVAVPVRLDAPRGGAARCVASVALVADAAAGAAIVLDHGAPDERRPIPRLPCHRRPGLILLRRLWNHVLIMIQNPLSPTPPAPKEMLQGGFGDFLFL